uniref:Receptor protein-tyrosine kinase n=1 Tax=Scophthalmus maximus TaxID=52904 RepID=A0A8D3CSA9_SCOMX
LPRTLVHTLLSYFCYGTQNSVSMMENQYNQMKERYTGCEIVMGNLEITMMEHTRDFSFLQSIREVTGYILFAVNDLSRLPLDQLRVIRGNTLYDNQFALAVMVNYQKDGQYGLQELGLTHLTEILEGGVKIIRNKYLSYAPQVNWLDIVKDGTAHIVINDNGPESECKGITHDYHLLTKTVCAPQCNRRCFGRRPSECCHIECAGGCTGPLDTDCFVCRNFNDSGSCVPLCPQTLIYNKHTFKLERNPNAKYQYESMCVAQCPANFVVEGSSCVSKCSSDKMEVEKNGVKSCEPCGGLCPKACHGTGSPTKQTVDALNIDSFINCTKILGSLHFLVTGIKGDEYNHVPALDPEKLKIFNTVREITDFLCIQSWPENMSDLSVFSNLQTIQGRSLYKGYSLMVMRLPSLTSLGLRSLRKINDGDVYITANKKLCYPDTINWTRIISSPRPQLNDGQVCDPLCSSDGCWGPGPNQCVSCKKYSRRGTCVPDCTFLTGERREFAARSGECMPCHPECKVQEGKQTCTGKGADECVACASLQDGPHCVSSCPEGVMGGEGVIFKYPNKQGSCEPCHINCTNGCYGPGIGDCGEFSQETTAIVLGVIALLFVSFSIFVLTILYRRGIAIRRKRAIRRYMESGESFEPLEPGEKGAKVHARTLKPTELRKIKLLGNGVFGSVHKGIWIPEGDTVKLPVAIKTIHDRTGRQTFYELTGHMMVMGSLDHINVVRILGICPGASLQLVTQLSSQGSLLEHVKNCKNNLSPQRLLNWCVQIAKGMYYLEENRMVHRNLAARNVLLKSNYTVQISDYGIADLLHPDDKKYFYNEVKTPIKWMALESILFRRYTHQSDVWSYGVTIWEMMSYGVEPYTTMRPQEVPDLLEKGERLSQPQICTIDVYMVMVKCWMIDENVRPTFKELANEFTRMARDPPRYLVVKVRMTDYIKLKDQGAEEVTDGMTPASHYLSPSRSHSHLSRIDTHRSRSRLNSARTVSESSEGCSTAMELEMIDFPLAGSLKRRRHREDSAYMSQRDSMSGGPPETPSPEIEEEDQNGYVLPGDSPERGDTIIHYSITAELYDEEYEYMNKQTPVMPRHSSHWLKPNKRTSSGSNEVQYEYMVIRGTEKDENPPAHEPPPIPASFGGQVEDEAEEGEEDEYVEDSNYHYTNRQPKLRQALRDRMELKIQGRDDGENGMKEHQSVFEPYVKVRAGARAGEPAVADTSFDNPDYWHSRIFHKPEAVPT